MINFVLVLSSIPEFSQEFSHTQADQGRHRSFIYKQKMNLFNDLLSKHSVNPLLHWGYWPHETGQKSGRVHCALGEFIVPYDIGVSDLKIQEKRRHLRSKDHWIPVR